MSTSFAVSAAAVIFLCQPDLQRHPRVHATTPPATALSEPGARWSALHPQRKNLISRKLSALP